MMGRQSGQMSMIILDLSELIPENHLLRKINQMISFDFIYDLVAPYLRFNSPCRCKKEVRQTVTFDI